MIVTINIDTSESTDVVLDEIVSWLADRFKCHITAETLIRVEAE